MRYRKKRWTKKKKKWRRMRKTVNLIEYKGGNYFKDRITVFNIKFHFDKYYSILAAIIKWIGVTLFKIELIAQLMCFNIYLIT